MKIQAYETVTPTTPVLRERLRGRLSISLADVITASSVPVWERWVTIGEVFLQEGPFGRARTLALSNAKLVLDLIRDDDDHCSINDAIYRAHCVSEAFKGGVDVEKEYAEFGAQPGGLRTFLEQLPELLKHGRKNVPMQFTPDFDAIWAGVWASSYEFTMKSHINCAQSVALAMARSTPQQVGYEVAWSRMLKNAWELVKGYKR